MIKTLDVPPNHSIRVIFDIDGPPQEEDEDAIEKGHRRRKSEYQIPMRVTIESNPDPDEDKPYELPL